MNPVDLLKTLFPTPMEQSVDQRFPWPEQVARSAHAA